MSFFVTQESTLSCVTKKAPRGCAECAKEGCFTAAHSHWERHKSRGDHGIEGVRIEAVRFVPIYIKQIKIFAAEWEEGV